MGRSPIVLSGTATGLHGSGIVRGTERAAQDLNRQDRPPGAPRLAPREGRDIAMLKQELATFIEKNLLGDERRITVGDTTALIEDGLIDSMGLTLFRIVPGG